MGTHLRVLSKSYPMNTNMTGFRWISRNLCIFVLWKKVALALEGLRHKNSKSFEISLNHVMLVFIEKLKLSTNI